MGDSAPNGALRLLGLDIGDRRIGVAISDPTGSISTPLEVYTRRSLDDDRQHIIALMHEYEATGVVAGLPKNMNGTEGPQAEKTREFVQLLQDRDVTVNLWDERLSTIEVTRRIAEQGRRRKGRQQRVDAEAAALILQTYLDHLRIRSGR